MAEAATFYATCRNDGCSNNGERIPLAFDPDDPPGAVMCGACGTFITETEGL